MTLPAYAMNQMSFPEMYERLLVGPLFKPWAELTLDQVGVRAGDRILDVACGTGIVARLALARTGNAGRVVGVDLNPAMLAVARAAEPNIDWREGSATALPLHRGEQYDVVVCQQGMQFFPDKPLAARELCRALAPGGRLAVSTWRSNDEMPLLRELHRVAQQHLGPIADTRHAFSDGEALQRLLTEAGVLDVRVTTMARNIHFSDGAVFIRLNAMALVGMSPTAQQLSEEQRAQVLANIERDSENAAAPYTGADGLTFEIYSNVAIGRA